MFRAVTKTLVPQEQVVFLPVSVDIQESGVIQMVLERVDQPEQLDTNMTLVQAWVALTPEELAQMQAINTAVCSSPSPSPRQEPDE